VFAIDADARMIERVIVKAAKPFPPVVIRPNPFLEPFLDAFLFFPRGLGGLRVDDGFLVHIIINGGRFEIERFLDEFEGGIAVRSPIGRVGGRPFRLPIARDVPRAERMDVADLNTRRNAEQSVDEMLHVRGRQPGRAQPHVNSGGGQIRWLHRFQRLDILAEADIGDTGGIGGNKFLTDIAKPNQEILLITDERGLTPPIFQRKLRAWQKCSIRLQKFLAIQQRISITMDGASTTIGDASTTMDGASITMDGASTTIGGSSLVMDTA
jgi:hypothetical protein